MSEAKRDQNRVTGLLGESSLGTGATVPVYVDPTTHEMLVQGNVKTLNTLITDEYDSIAVTYPDTSTEVYTFKYGVITVGVITVVYSDAVTKQILLTVTKT